MNDNKSLIRWVIGLFLTGHILLSYQVYQTEYSNSSIGFIDYYTEVREEFAVIVVILILSICVDIWLRYNTDDSDLDIYRFENQIQWNIDNHQKSESDINFILSEQFELIVLIKNKNAVHPNYFERYTRIRKIYCIYKASDKYSYRENIRYILD